MQPTIRRVTIVLLVIGLLMSGLAWAQMAAVNINTAEESSLATLPGIGPAKAKAIVAYRSEHGPFATVEDLTKVSGVGQKTLERLKDKITVASADSQ